MMRKRLEYRLAQFGNDESLLFEVHGSMDRLFACFMKVEELVDLRDFLIKKLNENPEWHRAKP